MGKVIEGLTNDTDYLNLLNGYTDTCLTAIRTIPSNLATEQERVFIYSCLSASLAVDCFFNTPEYASASLCVQANGLFGYVSLAGIVLSGRERVCRDLHPEANLGGSGCASRYQATRKVAICTLRESGLAIGNRVNQTALKIAASRQDSARYSEIVNDCRSKPRVFGFVTCWGKASPLRYQIDNAIEDALALPSSALALPPSTDTDGEDENSTISTTEGPWCCGHGTPLPAGGLKRWPSGRGSLGTRQSVVSTGTRWRQNSPQCQQYVYCTACWECTENNMHGLCHTCVGFFT